MSTSARQSGYALLAAVLITALAAVFTTAAAAALGAALHVQASDASAGAVSAAAGESLDRAAAGLARRPDRLAWVAGGSSGSPTVTWGLACSAVLGLETAAAAQVDVVAWALSATAQRRLHAVLGLVPAPGARGLVVAHDVRVGAPLTVSGGGLYSGGSVSGREWVTFVDPATDGVVPPADHVRGEEWPVAAVHALGGIWAAGAEVHEVPSAGHDTDVHTGSGDVGKVVEPPSPAQETLLERIADVRLGPDAGALLDLSMLPPAPPSGAGALVVVVDRPGSPVTVAGERATGSCPVVLLIRGEANLGAAGRPFALTGAVLSLGSLTVTGPSSVDGHLWASALAVDAPLVVATPADWRRHPLPGLVTTVVLALGR